MKIKTKEKNTVPWGLWVSLFVTVAAYLLSISTAAIASIGLEDFNIGEVEGTFMVYAVNTATLLFVALAFIRLKKVSLRYFFKLPTKNSLYLLPVYYLVYLFITVIFQSIFSLIPGYNANQDQSLGFNAVEGLGLLFVFISLVILPPLGEEVIFRGILYSGFKNKLNKFWAALITSALFGLAHLQWNVGVDTFVLSLVIIYALEKHKSLWMAIGLHGIKNAVAFMALFVFSK